MAKLPLIFLVGIYIIYQLGFLADCKKIYKNIISYNGNEFVGFLHAILYLILSPGALVGGAAILIIFSSQFNQINLAAKWFIVIAMFVLFVINIAISFVLGGLFYFWFPWQVLLAFLLISLLRGFKLV